ncbi:MAG: hypothetical protein AMXMBFR61_14330 [Fimbriimonadales bacterium]
MKRTFLILATVIGGLAVLWWFLVGNRAKEPDVIYRTEKVAQNTVTLSFNASGVLQPETTVDVKSKAGGVVTHLAVEEGSIVQAGDLIAEIDPRDTRALYDQAVADLASSTARRQQSVLQHSIQTVQAQTSVRSAEAALEAARIRLRNLEERARIQPDLTSASIRQARADHEVAVESLEQLRTVTIPQTRAQAKGDHDRAKADLDAASANLQRQESLFEKGYASQLAVEQARSAHEAAAASYATAKERLSRLEQDIAAQLKTAEARVAQAKAALERAEVSEADVRIAQRERDDARQAVRQAEEALRQAKAATRQVDISQAEIAAAAAAIKRSEVSRDNAKVQLDSTTVLAPRAGVVIRKYLEEGTIIPPGTSLFSEGTSIVQIADVSRMYVEVLVDEADVGRVSVGQTVRVTLESAPRMPIQGRVTRVNPGADTANGVTQVKVRVAVTPRRGVKLMPGLNASCEFILRESKNVLAIPIQALQHEGDKAYVEVMAAKDTPVRRDVKTGLMGNTMVEITEGLKVGEEVVTSKIDMKAIREQEQKMRSMPQSPFSGGSRTGMGPGGGGFMGGGRPR